MRNADQSRRRRVRALFSLLPVRDLGRQDGRGRARGEPDRDGGRGMSKRLRGTLVLLGAGKMGGALLEGWLGSGVDPRKIAALDPSPPDEVRQTLARHTVRHNPDLKSIGDVEVILVAVKPQIMDDVLPGIAALR